MNGTLTQAQLWDLISRRQDYLERAILALFARQTADEQAAYETLHDNGVGFNCCDASFFTRIANRILTAGHMHPADNREARRRLARYQGQLWDIARRRLEGPHA